MVKGPLTAIAFGNMQKLDTLMSTLSLDSDHNVQVMVSQPRITFPKVPDQALRAGAHVIFIEPGVAGYDLDEFRSLRTSFENPILLVGLADAGTGQFDNMTAAGLDRVYPLPLSEATIQQMDSDLPVLFEKVAANWKKGIWSDVQTSVVQDVLKTRSQSTWQKCSIAFWSPKGGVGKTGGCVELAAMLSHPQLGARRTVIIDGNMVSGHVRFSLGAKAPFSIANSAEEYMNWVKKGGKDNPPAGIFKQYLWPVDAAGNLFLMPGIISSAQATADQLAEPQFAIPFAKDLVEYCRNNFDFTIIDLGSDINKHVHSGCLLKADFILVVCNPSRPTIADVANQVNDLASSRGIDRNRFRLVLNQVRDNTKNPIDAAEAAKTAELPVIGEIHEEDSGEFENTPNLGQSFVARFYNTKNSKSIETTLSDIANLAGQFYPDIATIWELRGNRTKKRGLFGNRE